MRLDHLLAGLVATLFCGVLHADVEFPTRGENWVNSSPILVENLRGKSAVLWFFEEQ